MKFPTQELRTAEATVLRDDKATLTRRLAAHAVVNYDGGKGRGETAILIDVASAVADIALALAEDRHGRGL